MDIAKELKFLRLKFENELDKKLFPKFIKARCIWQR